MSTNKKLEGVVAEYRAHLVRTISEEELPHALDMFEAMLADEEGPAFPREGVVPEGVAAILRCQSWAPAAGLLSIVEFFEGSTWMEAWTVQRAFREQLKTALREMGWQD